MLESFRRTPFAACTAFALAAACSTSRPRANEPAPAALGLAELGPAKRPPPLRETPEEPPPLPDLPPLQSHAAPAVAPASADLARRPCRSVWTGSQAAPLACGSGQLFGSNRAGAVALVPRSLLRRPSSALPAYVDHRLDGTEGPVRYQGDAPACTAFATAAGLDHALARWSGRPHVVSVMQIWARYHAPLVSTSLATNIGQPLASEQAWPFDVDEAVAWVPCSMYASPPTQGCGKPVDTAREQATAGRMLGEFTEVEYLPAAPPDLSEIQAKLAAGEDLVVVMELPTAFVPTGRPGALYIPHYSESAGPESGHAFVLAGYARLARATYFLMHNSWGSAWGDAGYAWLHEATVARWTREVLAIDAEPSERAAGSRRPRHRGQTTCPGALVPDSISGACAPACPDASPRHDGVCAVDGQCPTNYVNLTGVCVLGAPTGKGKDPETGISWACGPAGCSYEVPRARDPECTGGACLASCPAPDFRVARLQDRLVCVE